MRKDCLDEGERARLILILIRGGPYSRPDLKFIFGDDYTSCKDWEGRCQHIHGAICTAYWCDQLLRLSPLNEVGREIKEIEDKWKKANGID